MLNSTKDKVLGFLLDHVPSMSIPDIQGVKDDVQFAVTKLDMSGFKLRKEGVCCVAALLTSPLSCIVGIIGADVITHSFFLDVTVTLGKSINEEFLSCEARNISAAFNGVRWKYQQLYFPYLSGNGMADAAAQNASIKIGECLFYKLIIVSV
jgi:hypothetical protein